MEQIDNYLPSTVSIHVVHRLDRETSGLLVFAKSPGVCRKLKEQFENRKPERVYNAFVKGLVRPEKSFFRSFMATDEDLNQYSVEDGEEEEGKLAVTHYQVEKYLDDATWVKVKLETGRRNQIRVHFSENKNPVLGDKRYETELAKHPRWTDKNLALHAETLGFTHPTTGKKLSFKSEMPDRMKEFLIS
jgi:23S rRNA pseudouridine1911/1915/1917 synthase